MRARVYIDGFNLYYRALKGTGYKWLNPVKLAELLLDDQDEVDLARYFTARISSRAGDPDAPRRQQIYLSALATLPNMKIHYGRFLAKSKFRPLAENPAKFVNVFDTEEKGSDVNLASYLLHDGWSQRYDVALVMSQDTDLCEPIRMVREDLGLPVGVIWLDGREPGRRMQNAASFVRHITTPRLAAAQFPTPLMGKNGHLLRKPEGW